MRNQTIAQATHSFEKAGFFGIRLQLLAQFPYNMIDINFRMQRFLAPDGGEHFFIEKHHRHIAIGPIALIHIADQFMFLGT